MPEGSPRGIHGRPAGMLGRYRPGSEGNLASNFENPEQIVKDQAAGPASNGQPGAEKAEPAVTKAEAPVNPETPAKTDAPVRHRAESRAKTAEKAEAKPP